MSLVVPPITPAVRLDSQYPSDKTAQTAGTGQILESQPVKVKYDPVKFEVICEQNRHLNLNSKNWVVLKYISGGM